MTSVAAYVPVTDKKRQIWMVFHCNTSLVVRQEVKYMHSKSQSQCGSTVCCCIRWPCQRCHVVSGEIILISFCLWLSLEGSSQGWREAMQRGVGEGIQQRGRGVGWLCWASGTAGICIPLSSVAGERKVGRHGGNAQQEIWQDCDKG